MRGMNCVLFLFFVVAVISVLSAWSLQSPELRMALLPAGAPVGTVSAEAAPPSLGLRTHPLANAGAGQTASVGARVFLDGSHSSDLAGDALTFRWSFASVPAESTAVLADPAAVSPTFVVDRAGEYVVQLVVNDGVSSSTPDTVVISTVNSRPVGNAGANRTVPVGAEVVLDGSASTDVDGDPLSFSWSFVSVPAASGTLLTDATAIRPSFHVTVPGLYIVQLVVNDGRANGVPSTTVISTINSAPVANAGAAGGAVVGQTVQLDGTHSGDADGDPLSFRWSLISKPERSAAILLDPATVRPSFRMDVAGTYVAQLVVNDGHADSAAETVRITTANTRPVANAGRHQTTKMESPTKIDDGSILKSSIGSERVRAGSSLQLDGSHSSDIDGDLLAFTWSVLSRPAGSAATLSDTHAVMPTFTPDLAGTYVQTS
jgi:hypothetical protein